MATNTVRPVDFKTDIFVGKTIQPALPDDSTVEIIDPKAQRYSYSAPYTPINTKDWAEGMATAIIVVNGVSTVQHFQIVDPITAATQYNQIMAILAEIDKVIEDRLAGGGTITVTINNKTLMSESLSSLYALRALYVNRANAELAKAKGTNPDNPIKSISRFTRGRK